MQCMYAMARILWHEKTCPHDILYRATVLLVVGKDAALALIIDRRAWDQ